MLTALKGAAKQPEVQNLVKRSCTTSTKSNGYRSGTKKAARPLKPSAVLQDFENEVIVLRKPIAGQRFV